MTRFRPLPCASALVLLLTASGALADVSAADVLNQWKAAVERAGLTLTAGSESEGAGTVTLSDVTLKSTYQDGSFTGTLATLTFREKGDGTVAIELPADYPVTIESTGGEDGPMRVSVTVHQEGLALTASGTPDAVGYSYTADEVRATLDDLAVEGADDDVVAHGALTMTGLGGTYGPSAADPDATDGDFRAATFAINAGGQSDARDQVFDFTFNGENMTGTATSAMPGAAASQDIGQALADGFRVRTTLDLENVTQKIESTEEGVETHFASTIDRTGLSFAFSSDGLSYLVSGNGIDGKLSFVGMPMPEFAVRVAEAALGITIPVSERDTPQDMTALVRLVDLDLSEGIWMMADPTGALPHDPATLILDVVASGKWLVDLFTAGGVSLETTPVDLQSVTLKELKVVAAGAEATASGNVALDSSAPGISPDLPAAEGSIDIRLVGVHALLDKLKGVFVEPGEIDMVKMMLGVFAVPGDGPDTLTSKIEITRGGQITANGMQLPM